MNRSDFNKLVEEFCDDLKKILIKKGNEYNTSNEDVFENFRIASEADKCTIEQSLWGMYLKHWVSVRKIVKDNELPSKELLDEKILDSCAYMILLKGIILEQINDEQ